MLPAEFGGQVRSQLPASGQLREADEIEGAGSQEQSQERQQQGNTAGHCVNEELSRSRGALLSTPKPDQEERRHQAQFPENEPMEEVQSGKSTEQAGLQKQDERKVEGRSWCDRPRNEQTHRHDNRGEQQHQKSQAIDAEEI